VADALSPPEPEAMQVTMAAHARWRCPAVTLPLEEVREEVMHAGCHCTRAITGDVVTNSSSTYCVEQPTPDGIGETHVLRLDSGQRHAVLTRSSPKRVWSEGFAKGDAAAMFRSHSHPNRPPQRPSLVTLTLTMTTKSPNQRSCGSRARSPEWPSGTPPLAPEVGV
jgi:hypothetical protein